MRYALVQGASDFEELGPGQVLSRLVGEIKATAPVVEPAPAPAPLTAPVPASNTKTGGYDRQQELAALQERIDAWNRSYPLGTKVQVSGYDGPLVTRTRAMTLFGHRAAIYLDGYNGYFDLNDVRPV